MEKTLAELIREYKSGNEKSFEKIAEKMNPFAYVLCRQIVYMGTGGCQTGDAGYIILCSGKDEILQKRGRMSQLYKDGSQAQI